jgi:uncharacterized protein involved in outer membrane biogenesis
MRRAKLAVAVIAVLLVLAGAGLFLVVPRLDLAGFAAARATAALGRTVTIERLRLVPGRLVRITLHGARIDNIDGGSQPAMATLAALDGDLHLLPLLRGSFEFSRLRVQGLEVLLERTADRRANWRFGATPPPTTARRDSPVVLDLEVADSEIVVRTSSGKHLATRITAASLTAAAIDQPAKLRARGSYDRVPLLLEADLGSFAALHDPATPFPMTLRATSDGTTLVFAGTATDPLNFDGLVGRLSLRAPTPATLLALAGADAAAVPPVALDLAGAASRAGDRWQVTAAEGRLDGAPFGGRLLRLTEGASGQPDAVALDLSFTELDLNRLLGAGADAAAADPPLRVAERPDPQLQLRLAATTLRFRDITATQVALQAEVMPRRIGIESLTATAFDAKFVASGALEHVEQGARVAAGIEVQDGEVDALRRVLGLPALPLSGQVEARITLATQGDTVNQAGRDARIGAVLAVRQGSIARELIEMASTDVRALFRTARGTTPLTCLLAVIDIKAGQGEAAPLRMRAGTGTVAGLATFDLRRRQLDLLIGSQRATTNFWALDLPVRVSGSFADPDIGVGEWPPQAQSRLIEGDNLAGLSPALRAFATANTCYQDTRRR